MALRRRPEIRLLVSVTLVAAALVLLLPGAGRPTTSASATPRPATHRFDGPRAFALLRRQVERYGPRPAGSDAGHRLGDDLVKRLPRGRFQIVPELQRNAIEQADGTFRAAPHGLRNIVGSLPGHGAPLVIGAHYDTEASIPGHLGANDGAAGTAAVVELARALGRVDRGRDAPPIRFVLFDGEEEPGDRTDPADFDSVALRGSRLDAAHRPRPQAMILLDYIAGRSHLRLPREGFSDRALWARLRAASRRAGTTTLFPAASSGRILDDHLPYVRAGVPSIDLIDFAYPQADTLQDDLAHVSERSLDAVGETVLELVRRW